MQLITDNSATDDEEALSAMIAKDIDLRAIPLQLLTPKLVPELESSLGGSKGDASGSRSSKMESPSKRSEELDDGDEFSSGKKRSSPINSDEPNAKKSKAEMIDA